MAENENKEPNPGASGMDQPEQYETDTESLFDRFESERNVDPIPVEDLNEEVKEERNKEETKHHSSSEKKYLTGFE
ncbi:hypothetical protein AWM70_02400 [Paenibacillus yonginensis]|uniref:Uncharacterized protein n=1 Tax=Paenibacillus yonginensis TaxID=1462996 RepID=A0A1B1MWK8_9BACL|nr:hypothetical protein [Paenibacillus yonginensis]ANS73570.1 hypothetical protein AWM70_02400 [Paenibacillus yonginensis]